jgi:hypothetical protein
MAAPFTAVTHSLSVLDDPLVPPATTHTTVAVREQVRRWVQHVSSRPTCIYNNRAALVVPSTAPIPVVAVHTAAVAVGDTRATRDSERTRLRCKPSGTAAAAQ